MIKFFRLHNNRKGFTLAEIMIAAGIMGVLSIVLLQITKDQTKTKVRGEIDNTLAQVQAEILSLITSPAHCNANFAGKSTTATPITAIRSCDLTGGLTQYPTAACRTAITNVNPVDKYPIHTATWVQSGTRISDRVRITALSYAVASAPDIAQGPLAGQGDGTLMPLRLNVTFQYRDLTEQTTTTNAIKTLSKSFTTAVVVDGTTVSGCPRAANSTTLY